MWKSFLHVNQNKTLKYRWKLNNVKVDLFFGILIKFHKYAIFYNEIFLIQFISLNYLIKIQS